MAANKNYFKIFDVKKETLNNRRSYDNKSVGGKDKRIRTANGNAARLSLKFLRRK